MSQSIEFLREFKANCLLILLMKNMNHQKFFRKKIHFKEKEFFHDDSASLFLLMRLDCFCFETSTHS